MSDRIIRALTKDAGIFIAAADTCQTVARAQQIHNTLSTATAALGRTLTICSIMGNQLKAADGSVTVQFKGNGPLGAIVCVADADGCVRGYLQNPACELPLRPDGKLAVGEGVGRGYLLVIKDVGMKEPVTGTTVLVNGEIAEDMTQYFAESEQIPSACALGVLLDADQTVRQAGGFLVQLMPGATEAEISRLETNLEKAGPMTAMLDAGLCLEDIVRRVLDGFDVEFLDETPIAYRCNCTQDKVSRALISLGEKELKKLAAEDKDTEVTCQFCDRIYQFTPDAVQQLLQKATSHG